MNSYGLIDLHCDTLADWKYANTGNPDTLDDPGRVLQLSNMPNDVHWAQFYAVFIPDEERSDAAIAYFEKNRINFYRQMEKFSDHPRGRDTLRHVHQKCRRYGEGLG